MAFVALWQQQKDLTTEEAGESQALRTSCQQIWAEFSAFLFSSWACSSNLSEPPLPYVSFFSNTCILFCKTCVTVSLFLKKNIFHLCFTVSLKRRWGRLLWLSHRDAVKIKLDRMSLHKYYPVLFASHTGNFHAVHSFPPLSRDWTLEASTWVNPWRTNFPY